MVFYFLKLFICNTVKTYRLKSLITVLCLTKQSELSAVKRVSGVRPEKHDKQLEEKRKHTVVAVRMNNGSGTPAA